MGRNKYQKIMKHLIFDDFPSWKQIENFYLDFELFYRIIL